MALKQQHEYYRNEMATNDKTVAVNQTETVRESY